MWLRTPCGADQGTLRGYSLVAFNYNDLLCRERAQFRRGPRHRWGHLTPPGELPKNDPFLQKQSGRPNGAYMTDQIEDEGIDEDVSPPTKISYISGRPTTLHLRKCKLIVEQ